jgi:hypothetical protein
VVEFIFQDVCDGRAQRPALIGLPERQVFPHPVHLDGFQDQMDCGRAEEAARQDKGSELEAARKIEGGEREVEEILPESEVGSLDPDQLVEDLLDVTFRQVAKGLVERQVKELIQYEPSRKPVIVLLRLLQPHRVQLGQIFSMFMKQPIFEALDSFFHLLACSTHSLQLLL